MRVASRRTLPALPAEVWKLLAEPYHLTDWWPGYAGVEPDRRGVSAGARWQVARTRRPGLVRKPGAEGLILIERAEPERELAWSDLAQRYRAQVLLEADGDGSVVEISVEAAWWRLVGEGLRTVPRRAGLRLERLCETASTL